MCESKLRPAILRGKTHRVRMSCGDIYITVNGDPVCEVFIRTGKTGGCQHALLIGLGRVISIALQSGVPLNRINNTLEGIFCPGMPPGEADQVPKSCLDAIANILRGEHDDT